MSNNGPKIEFDSCPSLPQTSNTLAGSMDPSLPPFQHNLPLMQTEINHPPTEVKTLNQPAELLSTPTPLQASQAAQAACTAFYRAFFHTQYQPPTENQPPTQPDPASKEPSSLPARVYNRNARNWRPNEDIALCEAWVRCSENMLIRTGQTGESLWLQIFSDFCEKIPGTARTKRGLENRWPAIHGAVTKWRAVVNKVHKNHQSSTDVGDEWGACYKMFKDDHAHDFKFQQCWEILRHSAKWNAIVEEKNQGRSNHRSKQVSATPAPASPIHETSNTGLDGIGLNGLHEFDVYPSADIDVEVGDESPSPITPTGPPQCSIPSEPSEQSLGRKPAKDKRHRSDTCTSESDPSSSCDNKLSKQVYEWMIFQNSQFQMMQETNKSQFEAIKAANELHANELHASHLVKKAKLENLMSSIKIVEAIGDAKEKLISQAPHLFSATEVLAGKTARFKQLQEIERQYDEIYRLEYSP